MNRLSWINDLFSVALIAGGIVGAMLAMQWQEPGGVVLFSVVTGFGLGIYSDRAR